MDQFGLVFDGGIFSVLDDEGPEFLQSESTDNVDGLEEALLFEEVRLEVGVEVVGGESFDLVLEVFVA